MNLFYIKHHYQSVVRDSSFDGEVLAYLLLTILIGGPFILTYDRLDLYANSFGDFFNRPDAKFPLFLTAYVLLDLLLKMVFRRPNPKMKYYVLWNPPLRQIVSQYLFTSLFGIMSFVLLICLLAITLKANEWMGLSAVIPLIVWWVSNHFFGLANQYKQRIFRLAAVGLIIAIPSLQYLIPALNLHEIILHPFVYCMGLVISIPLAFWSVNRHLNSRGIFKDKQGKTILQFLPILNFKNPFFQLEWALLIRNKRTRSNLVFGIIAIIVFPLYADILNSAEVFSIYGLLLTGFFLLQHGVYSYGWEGAFFDLLLSGTDMKKFLNSRWHFYAIVSILCAIPLAVIAAIKGISQVYVISALLFNIGISIPLVLYRGVFHDTRIDLSDSILSNYQGMLTGPILFSSFILMLLPILLYALPAIVFGQPEPVSLGFFGLIAWSFKKPIVSILQKSFLKKKYHLSQSFKS